VVSGAFDEIFVGRTPVLMGVEPASLCWVLGQVADNREGQTWAREFDRFPALEHAVTDAGSGLVKGLALTNQGRTQPVLHSLDVFHTLYEGQRAWRRTESQVWKLNDGSGVAERSSGDSGKVSRQGHTGGPCGGATSEAAGIGDRGRNGLGTRQVSWSYLRRQAS
jgi:hypothetical protein